MMNDDEVGNFTENVLLSYFLKRSNDIKPSSLWYEYSMLRTKKNIKYYKKQVSFVKKNSVGNKFLKEAPGSQDLMKTVSRPFFKFCERFQNCLL